MEIQARLEQARRTGRARQRRIQLPLTAAGALILAASVGIGASTGWLALAGFGGALGPWVILLGALPTQSRSIGIALVGMVATCTFALFASCLRLFVYPCNSSARQCTALRAANAYAVAVLSIAIASTLAIALALAGNAVGARWPKITPRAAIDATWRIAALVLFSYALAWIGFGALGLGERTSSDSDSAFVKKQSHTRLVFVDFAVGVELIVLGSLSLWPRLRSMVQAKLSAMGEGVAAAAG